LGSATQLHESAINLSLSLSGIIFLVVLSSSGL